MNGANLGTIMSKDARNFVSQSITAGMPISDAMLLGAEFDLKQSQAAHHNYEVEMGKQKAMQQMLVQQRLSELGIENPLDVEGNFKRFVGLGLEPTKAMGIANQLAENPFKQQMQNEKMQNEMQQTLFKDQKKVLSEAQDIGKTSAEMLGDLKQLKTLMPDISYMGFGAENKSKFIDPIVNKKSAAAAAKFQSIANQLVSTFTTRLKGALSEKELDFLIKMAPSLLTNREGNEQIIEYLEKAAKRGVLYSNNLNKWLKQGGSVEDFKEYWNNYIAQNPLNAEQLNFNENNNMSDDKERARWEQLKAIKEKRGF